MTLQNHRHSPIGKILDLLIYKEVISYLDLNMRYNFRLIFHRYHIRNHIENSQHRLRYQNNHVNKDKKGFFLYFFLCKFSTYHKNSTFHIVYHSLNILLPWYRSILAGMCKKEQQWIGLYLSYNLCTFLLVFHIRNMGRDIRHIINFHFRMYLEHIDMGGLQLDFRL